MALEHDLDALYKGPLGDFLERRKALAQALRKAGRKDDAAKVAGAVKPTVAAWAVNELARREPSRMAALLAAGEQLRALLRTSFTGRVEADSMAEARSAQREVVVQLTRSASQILEAEGASTSPTILERVAATLTTISTTGAWGGSPPSQLTRELDPPSLDALATLVSDLATGVVRTKPPVEKVVPREARREDNPAREPRERREEGEKQEGKKQEGEDLERENLEKENLEREKENARRAAVEVQQRIERAEAALRAASALEEKARTAAEQARAASVLATSRREQSELAAREARNFATVQEQAAEEARRKAEAAVLAARTADNEVTGATRGEQTARAELAEAEKALARATSECIAAEERLVAERRATSRKIL